MSADGSMHALDLPILPMSPRDRAIDVLAVAGAPVTLSGLLARLNCERREGYVVIANMIAEGLVKPASVGDRTDMLTLADRVTVRRKKVKKPMPKRPEFRNKLRASIRAALRKKPMAAVELAAKTRTGATTVRSLIREMKQLGEIRIAEYAAVYGSTQKQAVYALTEKKQ